jgi:hypothetical protein
MGAQTTRRRPFRSPQTEAGTPRSLRWIEIESFRDTPGGFWSFTEPKLTRRGLSLTILTKNEAPALPPRRGGMTRYVNLIRIIWDIYILYLLSLIARAHVARVGAHTR